MVIGRVHVDQSHQVLLVYLWDSSQNTPRSGAASKIKFWSDSSSLNRSPSGPSGGPVVPADDDDDDARDNLDSSNSFAKCISRSAIAWILSKLSGSIGCISSCIIALRYVHFNGCMFGFSWFLFDSTQ
ncbi:hypothetical protein MJO28_012838 [Puccinia striiformis f. sp. tritici]|uniref:Uncharacterized protein n=1 Tax=Puccinia striiformis f. sp. tritici TaxID=168172 RepID=A0ACC0DYJ2_9BASI|nr:hypothetical protein MJO28_012838 [Puccinia striiformis f. sp. tritici]